MINVCLKGNPKEVSNIKEDELRSLDRSEILWIDALRLTDRNKKEVEDTLEITLTSPEEAEEIESTSKYSEDEEGVSANMNFYESDGENFRLEPMSFILTNNDMLISLRQTDCEVFAETKKRLRRNQDINVSGTDIFLTLIEAHIDREADLLELVAKRVSELSHDLTTKDHVEKAMIKNISELQEKIMSLRESIFDCQRVLFSIRRSSRFPQEIFPRLQLMLKDIDSLINHADFSFQRLDSLQDTAMGLINIEQNEIVKILSVAAVIFMPPTLVASMYGMNFKVIPELDWVYQTQGGTIIPLGYIFALFLMIVLTVVTLWFFKYKKWL